MLLNGWPPLRDQFELRHYFLSPHPGPRELAGVFVNLSFRTIAIIPGKLVSSKSLVQPFEWNIYKVSHGGDHDDDEDDDTDYLGSPNPFQTSLYFFQF